MPENTYPNGYGRTDAIEPCKDRPIATQCTCCGGSGIHETGAGMDASDYECFTCGGTGLIRAALIDPEKEAKALEAAALAMEKGF